MRSALFLAVFAVVAARGGCGPTWEPCDGKPCGEACRPCPPEETCETFAATACDPSGQCVTAGTFTCDPQPPPPDPCLGKGCGDDCTIEPPCAPLCMMPSMLGKCDAFGLCQPVAEVKCEPPPPPPDPCLGKGCGDPCSTCDATAGMMCPAVMMYCDAAGACGMAYPVCRR